MWQYFVFMTMTLLIIRMGMALYMYTKHVIKMAAKEGKGKTALAIFMFLLERPC